MEVKNIQYYLYDDDEASTAEVVMVEENKLLQQLQDAVSANKEEYSEDELNAAAAMMLMHYQAVVAKPQTAATYNFDGQTRQQKEKLKTPKTMIAKDHNNQNVHIDTMEQIRQYRKCNYTQSSLLASCRNILKEFLAQNGL